MEICPNCQNNLKEIIYGTVFEMGEYHYGGCIETLESPTHICNKCKYTFIKREEEISRVEDSVSD